jgi:hypothetical protein
VLTDFLFKNRENSSSILINLTKNAKTTELPMAKMKPVNQCDTICLLKNEKSIAPAI